MLVGNKIDLNEDREVFTDSIKELALTHNIPYIETSALKKINVNEAFFEVVRYFATFDSNIILLER